MTYQTAQLKTLLRAVGRDERAPMLEKLQRSEIAHGQLLLGSLETLAAEVDEWLASCADRILQDEATAET
jgi:hypothetical protein